MNANLQPVLGVAFRRLRHWSGHPAAEKLLRSLTSAVAAFVLAGATVGGSWLPLPLALAAALGLRLESFAAYIGGCAGYLVLGDPAAAMEPVAAGLLIESCLCIFGDQISKKNRWLQPAMVMVFTALIGVLFLLEQRFSFRLLWRWLLRIAVGGGATACFLAALYRENRQCRLLAAVLLCGGLCAVEPFGMSLGVVAACGLAAAALGTEYAVRTAVLCGLALDLCGGGCATAVLALASLTGSVRSAILRPILWIGAVLLGVVLTASDPLLLAAAVPGLGLSFLLPFSGLFGALPAVCGEDHRMAAASELLEQLQHCLEPNRRGRADPEAAAVFDQAAERVCRMCSRWEDCWEENVMVTVDALERAAPAMMTRGKALREDLPQLFLDRCAHPEGFLNALNRELEDLSCRRQCRSRIRESRMVLARQYGVLSEALRREAPAPPPELRFLPEVGFLSRGRMEDAVSGDRGATFRMGRFFYLILCDGMGTGSGAAAEAGAAIGVLRTVLQSGVEPEEAMELLNGIYLLREDGGFATVDLLRADLCSGEAQLWKWGAAPSYLKRRQEVEKIGDAAPPPGIGIGEEFRPQSQLLSMAKGELLVLTSDGACGEPTERFLRQYGGESPRELASGIVNCGDSHCEDDRTAAVVVLRPRALATA